MTAAKLAELERKLRERLDAKVAAGVEIVRGFYGSPTSTSNCLAGALKERDEPMENQWQEVADRYGITSNQLTELEAGFEDWDFKVNIAHRPLYHLGLRLWDDYGKKPELVNCEEESMQTKPETTPDPVQAALCTVEHGLNSPQPCETAPSVHPDSLAEVPGEEGQETQE